MGQAIIDGPKPAPILFSVADSFNLDFLLPRIACGDRDALKSLYGRISPHLFGILLRMVRRRDVAEDILHDVFVTVWHKAYQFDARRGCAQAWLIAMTRRKAIDRLRRAAREVVGADEDVAGMELQDAVGWTDTTMCLAVRRGLGTLKPEFNRALELCYEYGLTHEEVAREMKVPLGTAKSWVRRGLAELRECLTGNDGIGR